MVQQEECQTKYCILAIDRGLLQIKKVSGVCKLMQEVQKLDELGWSYDVMRIVGHDNRWCSEDDKYYKE